MCDISVALLYRIGVQMGKEILVNQTTGNLLILKYLGQNRLPKHILPLYLNKWMKGIFTHSKFISKAYC